jgi:GNAT superfamily N-acetyltransferase
VSDERLDELAESARNRGLKLVRSRVRTPGKRRFGKVGLADASGKAVFGMDAKGPTAKPEDVEDYLRNLGAKDWGASLDVAVLPRKRIRREPTEAVPRRGASNVVELRPKAPKAKPARKTKPPPKPEVREARPADSEQLAALINYLGHPIDAKTVRKNLAALTRLRERPLVATLGKRLVGLVGVHRTVTVHRPAPVGRLTILVVAEDMHDKGIGRMLVEAAERVLRKGGCRIVEVTSNDQRGAAHAFYRHLGYQRTSMRFMKEL